MKNKLEESIYIVVVKHRQGRDKQSAALMTDITAWQKQLENENIAQNLKKWYGKWKDKSTNKIR